MKSLTMRGVRLGLMLAAAGAVVASPAAGQTNRAQLPPGAVVQPLPADDGAELRGHLRTLADNPGSIEALVGAGRAALENGDSVAALSFFSRALEVSPRDARAKAGMASVMVRMERGQPALNLFAEAVALGAPEAEIAGDRGLAYDMVGNPRRAQQDYALVLQRGENPEVRRRLALSLAISGERDAALRAIDAQLRRNERAAWRTQAFVLALTGDAAGANRTAQGMMPAAAAQAMAPFFARLSSLNPTDKAMAAHFGRFPANGRTASAGAGVPRVDPNALALATGAQPVRTRTQPSQTSSREPRRRPGSGEAIASTSPGSQNPQSAQPGDLRAESSTNQRPVQVARAEPARTLPAPIRQEPAASAGQQPVERPSLAPPQPETTAASPVQSTTGVSIPPAPSLERAAVGAGQQPTAGFTLTPQLSGAVPQQTAPAEQPVSAHQNTTISTNSIAPAHGALSDIAAVVAALPEDQAAAARSSARRPQPAPTQTASREARASTTRPAAQQPARQLATRPAHPSRHWVQIAGGANMSALPRELTRLRQLAPELARQTAWTTPLNATNRLLVGPFASSREAQEFVNTLARRDVSSFAWTSPAGQEIERLPAAR